MSTVRTPVAVSAWKPEPLVDATKLPGAKDRLDSGEAEVRGAAGTNDPEGLST